VKETIEFIDDVALEKIVNKALNEGYRFKCLGCGQLYKKKPQESYGNNNGKKSAPVCDECGCSAFIILKDIACKILKVKPDDGVLVFKEHHFKYCRCKNGKVCTGDDDSECSGIKDLKLIRETPDKKVFKCHLSELTIVILKSTKRELQKADEMGRKLILLP